MTLVTADIDAVLITLGADDEDTSELLEAGKPVLPETGVTVATGLLAPDDETTLTCEAAADGGKVKLVLITSDVEPRSSAF